MFHVARGGRGSNYVVGRVKGLEGTGKKLGGEEGEMVAHREDLGLCVKMVDGAHLHAASSDAEGGILEGLEFLNGRGRGVREPDRGGVKKEGADQGFVGNEDSFFLLAPGGASKCTEDVDSGGGTGDGVDVGDEREVGVECDPQYAGVSGEG